VGFENLTRVADFDLVNGIPAGAAHEVLIPDWLRAVTDARGPDGWLYSVKDLPLLMIPVVAYLGRTRNPHLTTAHTRRSDPQLTAL